MIVAAARVGAVDVRIEIRISHCYVDKVHSVAVKQFYKFFSLGQVGGYTLALFYAKTVRILKSIVHVKAACYFKVIAAK